MKNNQLIPTKHKIRKMSPDIKSSGAPLLRRPRLNAKMYSFNKNDRYCVDSVALDLRRVFPGARRERGPAYLNVMVDTSSGLVVDAVVHFGSKAIARSASEFRYYEPQLSSRAEQAIARLMRPDSSS